MLCTQALEITLAIIIIFLIKINRVLALIRKNFGTAEK
jgi:hypothetical protein